jgi:hypothetical protein
MKRIDKLIKLPVRVVDLTLICDDGGNSIMRVLSAHLNQQEEADLAEALCTLINGQNVDVERMAEEWAYELPKKYEGERRMNSKTMEDKELEQKIITVMKFDGWCNISGDIWKTHVEKDFYKWGKDVTPFRLPLETEYHTSRDWLHPVWEKFRDTTFDYLEKYDAIELENLNVYHSNIRYAITDGTPLEAFNALHDGIKWFNELNKEL